MGSVLSPFVQLHFIIHEDRRRGSYPSTGKRNPSSLCTQLPPLSPVRQPCLSPAPWHPSKQDRQTGRCLGASGWSVDLDQSFMANQLTAKLTTGTTAVPAWLSPLSLLGTAACTPSCRAGCATASVLHSLAGCSSPGPAPLTCLQL